MDRRLVNEITKLKALAIANNPSNIQFVLDETPFINSKSRIIVGKIFPRSSIYNQAAFQIEMTLSWEYPFKGPKIRFITPIYHPNINSDGTLCMCVMDLHDSYQPTTGLDQIVAALVDCIDNPSSKCVLNYSKFF